MVDVYLDAIADIACHPLYSTRETPLQPNGVDRQRHRSMPVHRLVNEMASNLHLEADSIQDLPEGARGTAISRPRLTPTMELTETVRAEV